MCPPVHSVVPHLLLAVCPLRTPEALARKVAVALLAPSSIVVVAEGAELAGGVGFGAPILGGLEEME